ncbi:MAG: hypothetical protein WBD02_04055 [Acidimicrobiia bacterium]
MLESVINISEGRDQDVLNRLEVACGTHVLDVHIDPDHHRSVFTLAGPHDDGAERGAHELSLAVFDELSLEAHDGVHPRLGTVDVVPFVSLFGDGRGRAWAVAAARRYSVWLERLNIPSFLYGDADPQGRTLPELRREAFTRRFPDYGPKTPDARHGAVAVGARPPLVALNMNLTTADLDTAKRIAISIRESSGGMPGVRSLGLRLERKGCVQVSMNIFDLERAALVDVIALVDAEAAALETSVAEIELVGLIPGRAFQAIPQALRNRTGWDDHCTIEGRLIERAANEEVPES